MSSTTAGDSAGLRTRQEPQRRQSYFVEELARIELVTQQRLWLGGQRFIAHLHAADFFKDSGVNKLRSKFQRFWR